jgi:hypothetical protein
MITTQRRGGSLVGPMLLMGLGVLLLLNNFGMLSWNVWEMASRLWPVLLIAVGLDLVVGRRSTFGSLFVAGVTVALLGAGIWYYAPEFRASPGAVLADETISQPLNNAERADVQIGGSVGTLQVRASDDSETLIEGQIDLARNERVEQDFSVEGGTAEYTLRSRGGRGFGFFDFRSREERTWELGLNPDVPMNLTLDAGVGRSVLDLSELDLTSLNVNLGAGEAVLTLPSEGEFEANVDGGVGDVTILIPEMMAARIEVDQGVGDVDVDAAFEREDDRYVSANYEDAENRVELEVNMGVGSVRIEQIED